MTNAELLDIYFGEFILIFLNKIVKFEKFFNFQNCKSLEIR